MKTLSIDGSRPIGAPANWDPDLDGHCGELHIIETVEVLSGHPVMYSFFKPSEEDLEALRNGGAIRLGVHGRMHPVIQLGVIGPKAMALSHPKEGFDMGSVIEEGEAR